jgi:hypothetical protein
MQGGHDGLAMRRFANVMILSSTGWTAPGRFPKPCVARSIRAEGTSFLPFLTAYKPSGVYRLSEEPRSPEAHRWRGVCTPTAVWSRDCEARLWVQESLRLRGRGAALVAAGGSVCHPARHR